MEVRFGIISPHMVTANMAVDEIFQGWSVASKKEERQREREET